MQLRYDFGTSIYLCKHANILHTQPDIGAELRVPHTCVHWPAFQGHTWDCRRGKRPGDSMCAALSHSSRRPRYTMVGAEVHMSSGCPPCTQKNGEHLKTETSQGKATYIIYQTLANTNTDDEQ